MKFVQSKFLKSMSKQKEFEKCEFPGYTKTKRYVVDLDEKPSKRWTHIIKDFAEPMKRFTKEIIKVQEKELGFTSITPLVSTVIKNMQNVNPEYLEEIEGIAQETEQYGLDFHHLLLLNVGYSLLARCTSGCIEPKDMDSVFHFRNMDWDMEILREITIEVDFRRKDSRVFLATQWVGYVGILTGMRTKDKNGDGWTLSLNYRSCSGYLFTNLKSLLFQSESIEFLIRATLESEPTYEGAVKKLSSASIISPCYLVITGTKNGQGVLLTRDRDTDTNRLVLADSSTKSLKFITQTNIDHWKNEIDEVWANGDDLLLNSLDRRKTSLEILEKIEYKDQDQMKEDLFKHLFSYPVFNYQTIYSTIMCVNEDVYETRTIKPSEFHLKNDPFYQKE